MHSLRTKIALLTASTLVVAITLITVMAGFSIRSLGKESSNQILHLMCETGQKNLDNYFESVEQSTKIISEYAEDDLEKTDLDKLGEHLSRVESFFEKTAHNTSGVLTYYYRIDPTVSDEEGFWYVDVKGHGFKRNKVTDISQYDTEDQSALVWFTVPKATGAPVWLPPYITDNLNVYVLSYNVPIYKDNTFIGVIGIEIDYNTIVKPVNNISLYKNGYAFINDSEWNIICHPRMEVSAFTGKNKPEVPLGMRNNNMYITYTYDGVKKQAVCMPLVNGMRLNVAVPISEINEKWHRLILEVIGVSAALLIIVILFAARLTEYITKPLRELTTAAEQINAGNYNFKPAYNGNDEVGILTRTFVQLEDHLKTYINDLNSLAYSDALTSVHNKGAFDVYTRELQVRMDEKDPALAFAVGIFDCDGLKNINDSYGHDKGDEYLRVASSLICRVFPHSPVFRIGGDEFAVIMQNEDYRNITQLVKDFKEESAQLVLNTSENPEDVSIAIGVASFEPHSDTSVDEIVHRADRLMYENKRIRKK